MNPRFERFIKTSKRKRDIDDDELPLFGESQKKESPPVIQETEEDEEPTSLFRIYRQNGNESWLKQDNPAARGSFNLFNRTLHPDRPIARGVAVLAAKGTTFPDKRDSCLRAARNLMANEATGEIDLVPEPENPHDPHALAIIEKETGRMLGYVPKASGVNKTYIDAINLGKFCGGYIIEAKESTFKGDPSALIFIATGWL